MQSPAARDTRSHAFQLVATLGPASSALAREVADAGATLFRLNASHYQPEELQPVLEVLSARCPTVPVIVDLQGAKMRLGRFEARRAERDSRVSFTCRVEGSDAALPLPHPEVFEQSRPGDTLSVDDGRVRLRLVAASRDRLEADVLEAGLLSSRKGVNVEEHPVSLSGLIASDRRAAEIAARHGVRTFAFSFMADGLEAAWLRTAFPGCEVIGKVERREAVAAVNRLASRVEAVWVCRGDLGVQLGPPALGRFVSTFDPHGCPVPVLMAGQVLEHLTHHREPTRSEVCHLYDLVARGYAGIVLSDETAIGDDPVHAVAVTAELLRAFRA